MILDFAGNGGAAGDSLQLVGYGAGATFTQNDATHWQVARNQWQIHSGLDAHNETITLGNGASIHATDFLFV